MKSTDSIPVTINNKFCGPPNSGNGGYVSGMMAKYIDGPAEVTLRQPPPLDKELQLLIGEDEVRLMNGELLIAECRPASLELAIPDPPSFETVLEHQANYPDFFPHSFPRCFVCGPARNPQDGLRIFTGPKSGSELVAAPWQTYPALFDEGNNLQREFYHSALDCPGAFALMHLTNSRILLGRMTAKVDEKIRYGEELVVIGWPLGKERRKLFSGTAIFNRNGHLKACAHSVWIEIPDDKF